MKIEDIVKKQEVFAVLSQFNPWWHGDTMKGLPDWKRTVYSDVRQWITVPAAARALVISGARQAGKTTIFLQCIQDLIRTDKVNPHQVLYATLDHPLLKLVGIQGIIDIWREFIPDDGSGEYLFIDEIQYSPKWETWVKHETDFAKGRRIAVTGSSIPLTRGEESAFGRTHTIRMATMSFSEYLKICCIQVSDIIPVMPSLAAAVDLPQGKLLNIAAAAQPLQAHFHDYLLKSGFPQLAKIEDITMAQKLLREDIIDKALKRDMTAVFGVRNVLELEQTFLYLCLHDGGIVNLTQLCNSLGLKRPTVSNFIDFLEASHLLYKLKTFSFGKEALRPKFKLYLADSAISGSVLLKGRRLLEDTVRLGAAVENAFFKHMISRYSSNATFYYWHGKRNLEVDIVAEIDGTLQPFEVKYSQSSIQLSDLQGMVEFCQTHERAACPVIVTRNLDDIGMMGLSTTKPAMRIPAVLACYWL
ncbi:MAG: ATP-binding protein [Synergistaceae bacterium]|nr:ATP-binding protein [Synergistaceae bacterium]